VILSHLLSRHRSDWLHPGFRLQGDVVDAVALLQHIALIGEDSAPLAKVIKHDVGGEGEVA